MINLKELKKHKIHLSEIKFLEGQFEAEEVEVIFTENYPIPVVFVVLTKLTTDVIKANLMACKKHSLIEMSEGPQGLETVYITRDEYLE